MTLPLTPPRRGVLKKKTKKNLCYEKQGILEDGDSSHRDGADGTDHHAGSIQLYVNKKGAKGLTFCALSSLFPLGDGFAHLLQQVVNDQTGLGVQSAVGLVAEQVFGVQGNSAGYGYS